MILRQLNSVTINGFTLFKSSIVRQKVTESLKGLTQRCTIACMACGAKPGIQFISPEWWVCGLHADVEPSSAATWEETA